MEEAPPPEGACEKRGLGGAEWALRCPRSRGPLSWVHLASVSRPHFGLRVLNERNMGICPERRVVHFVFWAMQLLFSGSDGFPQGWAWGAGLGRAWRLWVSLRRSTSPDTGAREEGLGRWGREGHPSRLREVSLMEKFATENMRRSA